jgi:class 3 adenylate cyclase/GAF domain-containing protein
MENPIRCHCHYFNRLSLDFFLLQPSSIVASLGGSMAPRKFSKFFSLQANSVSYRLKLSFALFFLTPLIGFLIISLKYGFLDSKESYYFVLAILVFSLFGYIIVRQIIEGVDRVAHTMATEVSGRVGATLPSGDELDEIENTFKAMNFRLEKTGQALDRRIVEIDAIRDLNHGTYFHFDRQTLITRALERALEATDGTGGAIFELIKQDHTSFLVCRCKCGRGIRVDDVSEPAPLAKHPGRRALETGHPVLYAHPIPAEWESVLEDPAQQVAVIPIKEEHGFFGLAVLVREGEDLWPADVMKFFSSYFSAAATNLKIQALGQQEQATAEDLKTVLYIIKTINSGLTEKEMLLAIAKKLQEVIPHHWIGLALTEEGKNHLKLAHSIHKTSPDIPIGMLFPEENTFFQAALRANDVLTIADLSQHPEYFEHNLWHAFGLRACLLAGLQFKGQSIGVICLGHTQAYEFQSAHERIFSMIAEGLSLAIEQSRLLLQAREKSGEMEVLNRIGRALTSSTFNIDRVLTYTIEIISGLINVEAGSLLLREGDELVFKVAIGKTGESLKGLRIKMGQGVVGWVAATGEPMMVQDSTDNPHFYRGLDEATGFITRNLLCIPMIVGGRTIGTIELINKVTGTFNDEDLNILKSVASSAAIAIENSRLYSKSINIAKRERLIRNIFQKYVPEEVATEILGRGERDLISLGERRLITLLNVDIRGYSHLAKTVSAEDVVSVLNYFFMRMGNIVLKHKGILDKYLGDGLLAIFGAPIRTRNPALDATLAGTEMVGAMELVDKYAVDRCEVSLKMGVSINTGEAIVGNVGFEKKMDYTAIGEVVNDTFRLQELTREKPNGIFISKSTYQQVGPFIHARPLGVRVLGAEEGRMEVFEVTGKKEMSDMEYLMHQAKLKKIVQPAENPGAALSSDKQTA